MSYPREVSEISHLKDNWKKTTIRETVHWFKDTTQPSYNCSLLVKASLWEVSLVNFLPNLENAYYDVQVPEFKSNFAIDAGFGI